MTLASWVSDISVISGASAPTGCNGFTPTRNEAFYGRGGTVDPDAKQQSWFRGFLRPETQTATHFAHSVIERSATNCTLAYRPAERAFVEFGRTYDVQCWYFDVADHPVAIRRRHEYSVVWDPQLTVSAANRKRPWPNIPEPNIHRSKRGI